MIKKNPYLPIILFILDAAAINASFLFAYYLRFTSDIFPVTRTAYIPEVQKLYGILVFITILLLAIFKLVGMYDSKRNYSLVDDCGLVFLSTSVGLAILFGMLFLYKQFWFSRLVIVYAWAIITVTLILVRIFAFYFQRFLYARNIKTSRVIIIGSDDIASILLERINKSPEFGYRVVKITNEDQILNLRHLVKDERADEIIFASSKLTSQQILDVITEFGPGEVQFRIVPGILEIIASRVDVDEIGEIPLIAVSDIQLKGIKAVVKRVSDILMSVVFLVILSPILLMISILIKLDSIGPVLYKQERIGKDGKPFMMYKFRSMITNADEVFSQLKTEADSMIFKRKVDPRMTRVGKLLRRYSFDELPQLINVLYGDMSVLGPRPPLRREVINYNSWHKKRLKVAPGLTGLWQVSGRSDIPFEEMIRLDIYYIENWSLWLDFKILCRTIPVLISGKGAY